MRRLTIISPLSSADGFPAFLRSLIRLALENVSELPTDFLKLTFDDSTVSAAQHALAEGELSVEEAYETEYDLINRPVLAWDGGHDHQIEPGRNYGVAVTCLGKVGW